MDDGNFSGTSVSWRVGWDGCQSWVTLGSSGSVHRCTMLFFGLSCGWDGDYDATRRLLPPVLFKCWGPVEAAATEGRRAKVVAGSQLLSWAVEQSREKQHSSTAAQRRARTHSAGTPQRPWKYMQSPHLTQGPPR